MRMKIVCLEHVPHEGPGRIADWAERRGYRLKRLSLAAGDQLPAPSEVDLLIVMGGPMNIYQHRDHPWLIKEKRFIEECLYRGLPALGICLGAQLLADVLGGKVYQNAVYELGWLPVKFGHREGIFAEVPEQLTVLHWHGDTFSLPPGAIGVASSAGCQNQAFVWEDRVVGLQFHLELDPLIVKALGKSGYLDEWPGQFVQTPEVIMHAEGVDYAPLQAALDEILDGLAAVA